MTEFKNAIDKFQQLLQERVIKALVEDFVDSAHKLMILSGYSYTDAVTKSHKMGQELIPDGKQQLPLPLDKFVDDFRKQFPKIDPTKPVSTELKNDLITAYVIKHPDRIFGSDSDEN